MFLNGVSYGPKIPASCNGVRVSGLAGGHTYKVYLEAYPRKKMLSLRKSNVLVSDVGAVFIILNIFSTLFHLNINIV